MSGPTALLTAAADSPVRRTTSSRETGPSIKIRVNTCLVAGLISRTRWVVRMRPSLNDFIDGVQKIA
jgi:hypothetical protein